MLNMHKVTLLHFSPQCCH